MRAITFLITAMAFGTTLGIPTPSRAAWPHEPSNGNVAICTAAGNQNYPAIISDGAGGAIVTWSDFSQNSLIARVICR